MLHALDQTRLTAPDIAGAAGDAGEAADAASFASLLDTHDFTVVSGDELGDENASSEDDPSRVNDAAFLVLMVAAQQPATTPMTASQGENSSEPAFPRDDVDTRGGFLRDHLRLVQPNREDASASPPADEEPASTDAASEAHLRLSPLRPAADRPSEFFARLTRASHEAAARKQILDAPEAVPGETPSAATDAQSLDVAAIMARRAVDAAWSAQVAQDRSATRAALDHAGPATIGEPGVPRVSAAASAGNETFAAFRDDRRDSGNADAGGNAGSGSPFTQTRSAGPIAGLRPLHTLVPVAFEVARDNSAPGATTAAAIGLPNEDGVSTSIVQALRLQVTAGGGSATITLDPSYLGGVRVAVQVADGAVTATLHAGNPQVRAWMEANESALRQSLLDQGLTLDRLIVAEDHGADLQRDPNPQYDTPGDQPQPRQRRRDGDERFEVIV